MVSVLAVLAAAALFLQVQRSTAVTARDVVMLATIVDWAALGKVVLYSFAGALLLTVLFTTGVLLVECQPQGGARSRAGLGIRASFALCLALVTLGLYVMVTSE